MTAAAIATMATVEAATITNAFYHAARSQKPERPLLRAYPLVRSARRLT
jgi:hypothetical protein